MSIFVRNFNVIRKSGKSNSKNFIQCKFAIFVTSNNELLYFSAEQLVQEQIRTKLLLSQLQKENPKMAEEFGSNNQHDSI